MPRPASIKYTTIFTAEALQALEADGLAQLQPELVQTLPTGVYPCAGDLFADDRLSARMFVVMNRLFSWDENGDLTIQLLLTIAPGETIPPKQESTGAGVVIEFRPPK
jgi:hypothetical protein